MIKEAFIAAINHYENEQRIIYPMWADIETAYSSAGRYYHNLQHLDAMLAQLTLVREQIRTWDVVILALSYHDLVYDPLRHDNEEASAAEASRYLSTLAIHHTKVKKIHETIMATKQHQPHADNDINLFTDADLSILGADEPMYDAYARNIRKEYAAVPDELYFPGRAKVLRHFLDMPSIYKTAHFKSQLEEQARGNMARELRNLQA